MIFYVNDYEQQSDFRLLRLYIAWSQFAKLANQYTNVTNRSSKNSFIDIEVTSNYYMIFKVLACSYQISMFVHAQTMPVHAQVCLEIVTSDVLQVLLPRHTSNELLTSVIAVKP